MASPHALSRDGTETSVRWSQELALLPSARKNSRCTGAARRQTESTQIAECASRNRLPTVPAETSSARQTSANRDAPPTAPTQHHCPVQVCTRRLQRVPSPVVPCP